LLGELEGESRIVVCDLEAGVGTLLRMDPGDADVVLVVTQPTAKSIDVARRAAEIAEGAAARVLVVANRVRDDDDLLAIRTALAEKELIVVPDDPVIAAADREGRAPIDVGPDAPGVQVIVGLGEQLAREAGA